MPASVFQQPSPFDPITGDLLPAYRDAYLLKRLPPAQTQAVEAYLKRSPIQANVTLGRYHQLAEEALAHGRTLTAPLWVQHELLFQPSVSGVGPLRRPVVRLAAGLFALLCLASVVQWIRNEPLVPAPVVAAVTRVATTASQATQRLVQQLTTPAADAPAPEAVAAVAPARPRRSVKPAARPTSTPASLPVRPAALEPLATDSLAKALPQVLPTSLGGVAKATSKAPAGVVRGRITDGQGRALAGATVLVKGTTLATSTTATGEYVLEVPAGATLLFGYGGYADQYLPNSGAGVMNVVLEPQNGKSKTRISIRSVKPSPADDDQPGA